MAGKRIIGRAVAASRVAALAGMRAARVTFRQDFARGESGAVPDGHVSGR
ncbi:MAG: hypothetical protein JJT81_20050 [Rubellimicrobium sp.]|nr:hypothetical protein [Rubellimicrobium sp.]